MSYNPKFSEKEAKQGRIGNEVKYVLLASLFLALVAWAAVEAYSPDTPSTSNINISQSGTG